MGTVVGRVGEIWRYPVKSFAGEQIDEAELDRLGVPGDRRYALRDMESGKILSAKSPKLGPTLLRAKASLDDAPGGGAVTVALDEGSWRIGIDEGLDEALSRYLGRPVRMEAATTADEVYESYWPEVEGLALSDVTTDFPIAMFTEKGTFSDLAALHLLATSSLDQLRSLLPEATVAVERFRPSIVVETEGEGFVDNDWATRTLGVGEATVTVTLATPRCIMPTLDQPARDGEALERAPAILRTLARENRLSFPGFGDFACLGVYAEVAAPGTVRVGDPVVLHDPA